MLCPVSGFHRLSPVVISAKTDGVMLKTVLFGILKQVKRLTQAITDYDGLLLCRHFLERPEGGVQFITELLPGAEC